MIKEIWKIYDEFHACSNMGRIKTIKKQRGYPKGYIFKNIKTTKKGYIRIHIKGKGIMLHRIVAELFVENKNPKELTEINHKNGIRNDNRAENLEWISHSDNIKNSIKILKTQWGKGAEKSRKKVKNLTTGDIYDSRRDAAKKLGVSWSAISSALKRKNRVKGNVLIDFMN